MLDSQTTLILSALLFLSLPGMVWLSLRAAADRAVACWCVGGLLAGSGIVLMGLRPWLPVPLSFHLANTCVLVSLVFWSQSLRCTLGQPWAVWQMAVWVLLCAGFYTALLAFAPSWLRGLAVRLALGMLALQTAYWAWRLHVRMHSGNAAAIALNYLILGLMLAGQGLLTATSIDAPSPFSNTWDASLLALTALVTAMVGHLCYVGMVLDRAASERTASQLAEQSARQTRWLDQELRRMERHRRMTILSGSLAHELNQPLTAAMVNAELAQRQWQLDPQPSEKLKGLMSQVDACIDRTVKILQRIRSGADVVWPGMQSVDLQQVLVHALAQVESDLARLGAVLTFEKVPQGLHCKGDEVALSQVLVNLLRNALQAMADTPERRLTLVCRCQQDWAEVCVRDTGCGLSPELSQRWGEPMLSTKSQGLGMGLAISREIVDRHHGFLSLSNLPEGGVQAVLRLPLQEEGA